MELQQYKNLLDQVKAVNTRYKKINELTGENFNVFRILKLESSETRMHSAFLAELLNPNGTHGQKDVFLKLFVELFCFKKNTIDTHSCIVEIEKHIGFINKAKIEGGRIDLLITDKNQNSIIVENKIYAGDQENQLLRYYKFSHNADIIYLTLYGKPPEEISKGEMLDGEHYKCISYEKDILNWLELCRKEVAIYPIVREGITHYINLVKHLTSQTLNHNMEEELSDLIKINLEASFNISRNLDKACQKASNDFGRIIENAFQSKGLQCQYDVDFEERYNGFWISKSEWKHVKIGFQFQSYDKDMVYGFCKIQDPSQFVIPSDLEITLKALPNNTIRDNNWWPWFNRLESPYGNWHELEVWLAIFDGRMKAIILEKVEYLLSIVTHI